MNPAHPADPDEWMDYLDSLRPKDYDIGDSNERQNEYWKRVGGHPAPGEYDV